MNGNAPGSDASQTPPTKGKAEPTRPTRWYQRPTIRAHIKQARDSAVKYGAQWDDQENESTRLPEAESVHFGGLVMVEAFTPSTVASLYRTLGRWPEGRRGSKAEVIDGLTKSRSGHGGGWQQLGVVRPPGAMILTDGHHDADLPDGIDAVWIHLSYLTPSLALVAATFTLAEEAGDLSGLLRADYARQHEDIRVKVPGRFGELRSRIPWARPRFAGTGYSMVTPEEQKRRACASVMDEMEEQCGKWFYGKFRGRFARAEPKHQPSIRLMFTQSEAPFQQRSPWLRPVNLAFEVSLWSATDPQSGWWLTEGNWGIDRDRRLNVMTFAARRGDATDSLYNGNDSNWTLTQVFGSDQAPLIARRATSALLLLYADRLGDLRDSAGSDRFPRRPVRAGKALDRFLIRDGLDAATVTGDIESLTSDPIRFAWNVPDYEEFTEHLAVPSHPAPPGSDSYLEMLRERLRDQASRLDRDMHATTDMVKASADLRQAITNTQLQRIILLISLIAVAVAVVSLLSSTK